MSSSENVAYVNLAQVIAANEWGGSLWSTMFRPIADVLAKIGIEPTRPRILWVLQNSSAAMSTGVSVNNQVGNIVGGKENALASVPASNSPRFQEAA